VVATDLQSGDQVVFRRGNTGIAVRASSSVPGVFQPVTIQGREYVDGGLTSPVPVKAARDFGADIVIAVDISKNPTRARVRDTIEILLQTFTIMGRALAAQEMQAADIVITPSTEELASASFESRNLAILEGERAAQAVVPKIRQKIAERAARLRREALERAAAMPR
jgi:NTE family protein